MALLKQSTAYTRTFLMVQTADHLSGLTGATPTVTLSKAGAAFAAAAGAVSEIANGFYKIALTTADTNTVGDLAFHITAASGDATDFVDQVSSQITSDLMATYTQPTGFLAATFPAGTIASTTNITGGTITTVTNQLTAAQVATGVWQDATAGDFTVASSIGKSLYTSGNAPGAASGIALVGSNMGTITGALTGAQIATAVWTDTTAADFTTALSIGKSIMNGVALGTGLTVNDITTKTGYSLSGTQTFNVTGNITGNLSGSVGSVSGSVASVTGSVGSVTGAVGSVTARVTANTDQVNGNATAAANVANSMQAIARGTCSGGTTTTAIVSSMTSPASLTAIGQLIGRTILFDANTATASLQGQASNITASTTGATPTITFTAMTTAPANGDTFSVL